MFNGMKKKFHTNTLRGTMRVIRQALIDGDLDRAISYSFTASEAFMGLVKAVGEPEATFIYNKGCRDIGVDAELLADWIGKGQGVLMLKKLGYSAEEIARTVDPNNPLNQVVDEMMAESAAEEAAEAAKAAAAAKQAARKAEAEKAARLNALLNDGDLTTGTLEGPGSVDKPADHSGGILGRWATEK